MSTITIEERDAYAAEMVLAERDRAKAVVRLANVEPVAEDGCGCCVPTLPQSLGGHLARILVMLDAGTDPRA
ncbi:MAG: hypothetical protein E6Q97_36115 [Desulfurellales bacterium]|nr:MAG: hypothetical protein E6Q97_36115 [Desulfurellales bacterium]